MLSVVFAGIVWAATDSTASVIDGGIG